LRVLLADPPQLFLEGTGLTRQIQPLGLGYVGAVAAADHDVRFLLPDTEPYEGSDPWGRLRQVIAAEAPDVLGISAVTATYHSAARLAAEAKEVDPRLVTVLGGVHASAVPSAALQGAPAIDWLVVGEGEHTFAELLRALESGTSPHDVAGLAWRNEQGQVLLSVPRPPIPDLDTLPHPLRTNLVFSENIHTAFYQALITVRGCPFSCIYCAVPSMRGRKVRYRSAPAVVDEIEALRAEHAVPSLFFHDSVFTLNRKRTLEICELLVSRRLTLPFNCQTRVDCIDAEVVDALVRAGCSQLFFGIESGDAESLEKIGKRVGPDDVVAAVDLVKSRGIRCTGFFMVGFPWEDEALIEKTADFATSLGLEAVSLFSATPLPGTKLWEMSKTEALPSSIDFRTPQVNLTQLSDEAYREAFERARLRIDAYNQAQMMKKLAHLTNS